MQVLAGCSRHARSVTIILGFLGTLSASRPAAGQPGGRPAEAHPDSFDFSIRSETYGELFRRALLPGPNGALVDTEMVAAVHQLVSLRAYDIDASWRANSIDVELSAWGRARFAERGTEGPLDGDVQIASVRYRHGPIAVRFGRQHAAGGAARYVRFDGITLGAALGAGLALEGYGGFTALPRWDARSGYHHLGAAADSLIRTPDALPEPERSGHVLAGGRLGWTSDRAQAAISFHEQHEQAGLSRRTLGVDARALLRSNMTLGGSGALNIDAIGIEDARAWLDWAPAPAVDLSAEILHTEPALFLSRQSVLSVFSTDAYEEAGGSALVRAGDRLTITGSGWVQFYDEARRGARGEIAARALLGAGKRTLVRLGYTRVLAVGNGYHSLRASSSRRFSPDWSGTLEAYAYLYDEAIRGHKTSAISSGTLTYQAAERLDLLWGASVAQSPYARFDAQTIFRIAYTFDSLSRSAAR